MFNDRYINSETSDMLDYISDYAEQRNRYILKPLSSDNFGSLKKKLPFTTLSKGTLSEVNPLLPKNIFGKNREVAFIKLENQKFYNIGLVALGEFHKGDMGESELPDSINLYLAKKDQDGKVMLWKNLKTTPGFEDVYKFGNSFYVQKQRIVPGANGDHRGSTIIQTNPYEIIQATRNFFDKADSGKGKEYQIVQGMLKDDYSIMDFSPIYKKSDTWSVKMNELASGKLENIMYTSSQIHDADFLKTGTSAGEQYLVSKKLDNEVFDIMATDFRRASSRNRVNFSKFFSGEKRDFFQVEDGKKLDELKFLKEKIISFNLNEFKNNLDNFSMLKGIFGDKELNSKYLEGLRKGDEIKGKDIMFLLGKKSGPDYLYKRKRFMEEVYKILNNYNDFKKEKSGNKSFNKDIDFFKFKKSDIKNIIDSLETEYKGIEKQLAKEMSERISSKFEAAFDRRYYAYLEKTKNEEDRTKMFGAIEKDITREFYDKYNEKLDLYDVMMKNRGREKISEVEAVADRLTFKYDSKGNIVDVGDIKRSSFENVTDLSKDADLKWGYYKARIQIGHKKFDSLPLATRLKYAENYKNKNESYKKLFEKMSEKTLLGKYDSYDNFKKSSTGSIKYNLLDDSVVARTNDKVIANMNIDNSLDIKGAMRYGDKLFKLNIHLTQDDGFNKNDYIKEMSSQRQASFKMLDLDVQKYIEKQAETGRKVYKLYKNVGNAQSYAKTQNEYDLLNKMKSFLQGQKDRSKSSFGAIWGLKDGKLVYLKDGKYKGDLNIVKLEKYNDVYDSIVDYLKSNYNNKLGYSLYDTYRKRYGSSKENMSSLSELQYDIIRKFGNKIDNTTFMAILNNDQLINTTGASKQQSLIHGNSYLGHLGFAQPGLAWNKVTQRTFQAQDILGEQYVDINGKRRTVSEVNADIIKRLGFSGVNQRHGQYVTDNLYKSAVNRMNIKSGLNNSEYRRGEVYKTFAIGDVNSVIKDSGINNFNASFQEGMTAAGSMVLTTNAIRNKQFNLNIEEIDYGLFGFDSKKQLHEKLLTENGLDEVLQKVINENLYGTISGRKKYTQMLTELSNPDILEKLDGSYSGMRSYYNVMSSVLGIENPKVFSEVDTERNRMKITKEIYKNLENLREQTGAIALPNTSKGKNTITTDFVKSHNELKPELGFSISDYKYNAQTGNIELMLENLGISTQGSKGQTTGAKFTISEKYDFLKIRSQAREQFIDAIFNNKAEKRTQTGMIVHSALQTVFTNVYESAGLEGVTKLKGNMQELLKDMGVNIIIDQKNNNYRIDERYLTVNPETKKIMTVDEFQKYMREPTENLSKLFNDRGRKILDNLIKKYSSQYSDGTGIQKHGAHVGILNAMTKAYSQTYKELGKEEIQFMVNNASVTGYADGTASEFGSGSFWLLKLASERVNSTASKKKESGLKISREMSQRQIAAGYREMIDYTERKNRRRLSDFLGDVFNGMSNAELLKEVHKHRQGFDIGQLNLSISETLRNGVLFNLDSLSKDDYLFNDKEVYLTHTKFMNESALGRIIKNKGLGDVVDGKLSEDINVVVNDKDINNFTKEIKKSLSNVKNYYKKLADEGNSNAQKSANFFETVENLQFDNSFQFERSLKLNINTLRSEKLKEGLSGQDIYRTSKFLKLIKKNMENSYSLEQLQTIMKTGNIITTINLDYDVDEATDQIVSSNSFAKIRNIAKKNYELNHLSGSHLSFIKKFDKKDMSLVDDIYSGMLDYYSGKTQLSDYSLYGDLFRELNFSKNETVLDLQKKSKNIYGMEHMLRANKESANKFLQENYTKLGLSKEEAQRKLVETQEDMIKMSQEIALEKQELYRYLSDGGIATDIKKKLKNTLFENERLSYDKKISSFYNEKIKEHFDNSFELLDEYITVPAGAENLFKKKGTITDKQKFKVDSSFVANPLEGSNLLNKFEELMFKIDSKHSLKNNLVEFQEFLGSDIVNENLFKDEEGINWLARLEDTNSSAYSEGLQKARKVFSKNLSNISEITITDKRYMNAFRRKDFNWGDLYDNADFKNRGFVRELGFLSRHPQQTINHMGAIMNITVDSTRHDLKNRFARATLTYLPKEKNNAGIITLGKKTMLYRRGD